MASHPLQRLRHPTRRNRTASLLKPSFPAHVLPPPACAPCRQTYTTWCRSPTGSEDPPKLQFMDVTRLKLTASNQTGRGMTDLRVGPEAAGCRVRDFAAHSQVQGRRVGTCAVQRYVTPVNSSAAVQSRWPDPGSAASAPRRTSFTPRPRTSLNPEGPKNCPPLTSGAVAAWS